MPHTNYFEIAAPTYYELGLQQGVLFGALLRESIEELREDGSWTRASRRSKPYLKTTTKTLPHLVEELKGCAEGAGVPLDDLWVLCIEDELFGPDSDKCTTIIANDGLLIAHNEDWGGDAQDAICVLRKTIGDLTILELFYCGTLGGNAISVNSRGCVQAINTLNHTDKQVGVPRNLVARWLSETSSPESDFRQFSKIPRSSGYSHSLVSSDARAWNLECSAKQQRLTRPNLPFVHTNHFLTDLRKYQGDDDCGSVSRYDYASARLQKRMPVEMVEELLGQPPVFNERTIARMIVDLQSMTALIWLLREAEAGWVRYDMDFVNG